MAMSVQSFTVSEVQNHSLSKQRMQLQKILLAELDAGTQNVGRLTQ